MTGDRVTENEAPVGVAEILESLGIRATSFGGQRIIASCEAALSAMQSETRAEVVGLRAKLTAVEALAEKMANEHGQSWNAISARRIRAALHQGDQGNNRADEMEGK